MSKFRRFFTPPCNERFDAATAIMDLDPNLDGFLRRHSILGASQVLADALGAPLPHVMSWHAGGHLGVMAMQWYAEVRGTGRVSMLAWDGQPERDVRVVTTGFGAGRSVEFITDASRRGLPVQINVGHRVHHPHRWDVLNKDDVTTSVGALLERSRSTSLRIEQDELAGATSMVQLLRFVGRLREQALSVGLVKTPEQLYGVTTPQLRTALSLGGRLAHRRGTALDLVEVPGADSPTSTVRVDTEGDFQEFDD